MTAWVLGSFTLPKYPECCDGLVDAEGDDPKSLARHSEEIHFVKINLSFPMNPRRQEGLIEIFARGIPQLYHVYYLHMEKLSE